MNGTTGAAGYVGDGDMRTAAEGVGMTGTVGGNENWSLAQVAVGRRTVAALGYAGVA